MSKITLIGSLVGLALLVFTAALLGAQVGSGKGLFGLSSVNYFEEGIRWTKSGLFVGSTQQLSVDSSGNVSTSGTVSTTGGLAVTGASSLIGTTSVTGIFAIGTSSPSLNADIAISSSATSTLYLASAHGTKGGCIQFEGPASTTFRAYATTTGPLILESGICR